MPQGALIQYSKLTKYIYQSDDNHHKGEKGREIWLSPVTKSSTPTEQSKKQRDNIKRYQNFDYTTIADRLRLSVEKQQSPHWCG